MSLTHDLSVLVDSEIPLTPEILPATLGRYVIQSEIGQGAMGIVYRATDPVLDRPVALKVIRLPFAMGLEERAQAEQRFLREASLAASISHPNSVVVHDFGRDEDTHVPFIAFEYLQGRSLTDFIKGPRMGWREALHITARLAGALHHAHLAGVIHRDVKPANVMLLESGEPKILDFGIARVTSAEITGIGDTWGTPSYMSPEQVTGGVLDSRSDLFSLGALCFELLTGQQAFRGENVPQIVSRIAFGEAPRPSSLEPALSRDVDLLLARALAKDAAQRYPDGRAFAEDIEAILAGQPLRDRPGLASASDDSREWVAWPAPPPRRPRRAFGWSAAIAASLVAIAAFVLSLPDAAGTSSSPISEAATTSARALVSPFDPGSPFVSWAHPAAAAPAPNARVALSVEHRFERGRLRVFVDDALALDRRLSGRPTRHLLILKRQTGSLGHVLEVPPGQRLLRFEIDGDGERRTGTLRGAFRSDQTRLLRLKAGKRLDLEWQS